jgi:hypothetical protein
VSSRVSLGYRVITALRIYRRCCEGGRNGTICIYVHVGINPTKYEEVSLYWLIFPPEECTKRLEKMCDETRVFF